MIVLLLMKKMRLALPKMGKDFFSKLKCKCFGKHPSEPELETQLEERAPSYEEHRLSVEQIAEKNPESNICLSDLSKSQGLTQEEAKQRMEKNGKNLLSPAKQVTVITLMWRQFSNMFIQLLLWSGILSLITYALDRTQLANLYGAVALFVISTIMCAFSFYEEKKALAIIKGFHDLVPPSCTMIREGKEITIEAENLVNGDLVKLQTGMKVPADLRILTCKSLKLETSAITGESAAMEYHNNQVEGSVFDAHNVAFNGSFCLDGEGLGVVIRTGDFTMIGQIAKMTNLQKQTQTLLQKEISRFVRFIAILSIGMGTVIFGIALGVEAATGPGLTAAKVLSLFINGFLVVLLANVPEGLPATVTSQLTIIARRLAKRNVCVKRLDIVETLGATTVIASDKTGTLTMNIMAVTDLWYNNQFTSGAPEAKKRRSSSNSSRVRTYLDFLDEPLPDLLTAMVVCNKAVIDVGNSSPIEILPEKAKKKLQPSASANESPAAVVPRSESVISKFVIRGSPSEVAMLRFCENLFPSSEIRHQHEVVCEIPFNSVRKWHLVVTKCPVAKKDSSQWYRVNMTGAPEILIKNCTKWASDSGFHDIDDDFKDDFEQAYMHFGKDGRRVIGFCSIDFQAPSDIKFDSEEKNFPTDNLCFLGMAAIMDPPRPEVKGAIETCKSAGIKVFMVTGDHPVTAAAIARQIGLIAPFEAVRQVSKEQVEIHIENPTLEFKEEDCVICGDQLSSLTVAQWDSIAVRSSMVFARTSPDQKLLIVEELQKRGEIVAVTGDGVNDAPALKRADIGIAMGKHGSEVAKQAADIVLMDDNFASIVKAIEYGRLLFANLRKTIAYTMTHMPPEIFQTIMNLIFGFPIGLTSLQVLSIDLGSELPPAISLAYETAESNLMQEPPRKRTAKMVNWRLLVYCYVLMGSLFSATAWASYASVYVYHGIPIHKLFQSTHYWNKDAKPFCIADLPVNQTSGPGCFNATDQLRIAAQSCGAWQIGIVWGQVAHIWMCKTRLVSLFKHGITNISTVVAVILEISLTVFFIYVPGVNMVLGISPPPGIVYVAPAVLAVIVWVFNEGRKWFIRNHSKNIIAKSLKW